MSQSKLAATLAITILASTLSAAVPESAMDKGIQALERLLDTNSDVAMRKFLRDNIADSLKTTLSTEEMKTLLNDLRKNYGGFGGIGVRPSGDASVRINFDGCKAEGIPLSVEFDPNPPHKIIALTMLKSEAGTKKRPPIPVFTWDNLANQLQEEEKKGFTGTVLVVRNGKILLHEGYGLANREKNFQCTKDTIYAVGSTPIDFTRGAILKLEEMGRLKTSDPITKFFQSVPEDKKTITIDHLMAGRSGLPNFHHIPGEDDNYDLTWVDRDTAIKRIFAKEMRFAPGADYAHSHSAFGVLAAIVEIASKQSYQDFLDQHFFKPIGMNHTVIYERTPSFGSRDMAVGYGGNNIGKINAPPYWGNTSWLVMGSGGMVSTTGDLYKWVRGIWQEKLLTAASKKKYWTQGLLAGGNDRGFLTMYRQHPDTMFFLCSNVHTHDSERDRPVAMGLKDLMQSN